jgi:hypothetical protein
MSELATPAEWAPFKGRPYESFAKRAKRFAIVLQRRLQDLPIAARVRYDRDHTIGASPYAAFALRLCVLMPPKPGSSWNGLFVWTAPHNEDSEKFFGISREYGQTHNQFITSTSPPRYGLYHSMPIAGCQHWKRSGEAIGAVLEWVMDGLHIPYL